MPSYRETELLISEVQRRPILWNTSTEDYKDKAKTAEAWLEVCRAIYDDYDEKNKTEKYQLLEKEVKPRWKNVRDAYTKYCKKIISETESGNGSGKSRRYLFADQLSFLNDASDRKATTDCLLSLSSPPPAQKTEVDEDSVDAPLNFAIAQLAERSHEVQEPLKRKRIFPGEDTPTTKVNLDSYEEQGDPDMDFFKSILPLLKNLNDDEKIEFRVQVLLALQNIKSGRQRQLVKSALLVNNIQEHLS